MSGETVESESVFGTNEWIAGTLGYLVSLLIDSGDVAAMCRSVHQFEPDASGAYPETITVMLLPNGHIQKALAACPDDVRVHKTLKAMLKGGVFK